jgi:hypothetical protein
MIENFLDRLIVVFRLKGSPSRHQLIDSDGRGPNVNFLVVSSTAEHLWSPVEESPRDGEHIDPAGPSFELPTDAEVNQF